MEEKIIIKNNRNESLVGIFHKANNKKDVIIICHGFPGSKDEVSIKKFSEELQKSNMNSFRFDFSGFGESQGETISTTKRISDLGKIVDYFSKQGFNIGLIGYSRGGMVSILYAPKNKKIKFVISIAGPVHIKNFFKKIFPEQRELILNGEMFYYKDKKGRQFPVTPETIRDLESYSPLDAVKCITCPVLFIHGEKDMSVNSKESKDIYQKANHPKEIKLYENADHSFHNPSDLKEMIKDCIKWITKL